MSQLFRFLLASAHQGGAGGAVVRLAERAQGPGIQRGMAGHRVDGGDFQRLLLLQGGQQAREAAGEQRLAGARRPGEQEVVSPRRRHQQGALGRHLALHLDQVGVGGRLVGQAGGNEGFEGRLPVQVRGQLQQVADGDHPQATGEAGFLGVLPWHHQGASGGAGGERGRQHALDRTHGAGEGQLAQALEHLQAGGRHLAAGGEDAERDGEVEATSVLVSDIMIYDRGKYGI